MRTLLYTLAIGSVVGLAYWAYEENFETQQALKRLRAVQAQIGDTREALAVQRAEWAYLNRPDRLDDLVEMNFKGLELLPLTPGHFGALDQVAYPPNPSLEGELAETIEVSATAGGRP
ncbi:MULTISPECIES: cell division protein FtsL [unclassified Dinoroseobacter]|uniref:cell division protein FtsL n=1 Tax=unclassified Dinoroseobacter TaxID=2620028 RepID=UPI003C7D8EDC